VPWLPFLHLAGPGRHKGSFDVTHLMPPSSFRVSKDDSSGGVHIRRQEEEEARSEAVKPPLLLIPRTGEVLYPHEEREF
jgi:hypothetical protein